MKGGLPSRSGDRRCFVAADASVRLARLNDAPAVGVVQAAVFRETYAGIVPAAVLDAFQPDSFARGWRESLRRPPPGLHTLFVACADEQVVGIAALGPSQDPDAEPLWAELALLGVHPQGRGSGHGSRLLQACVDRARQAGAEVLAVWVPLEAATSRRFLEAAGLGPDGAYRDRLVAPDGTTAREVRLVAGLVDSDDVRA